MENCKVLKVTERPRPRRTGSGPRSARVPDRQYYAKTRVYVFPKGETLLENLNNRRTRPHNDYRKMLTAAGVDLTGARWSRAAGCGCGCSPGFILPTRKHTEDGYQPVDLYVTVGDPSDEADERASRNAELAA